MKLIYPRCCVMVLERQTVRACLRIQDAEGPVHEEVRTFAILAPELSTLIDDRGLLSDWLTAHGVTHVAIEGPDHAWKPILPILQRGFTVLRIEAGRVTDVKDLGRIASLLAYGLEPCRVIPPTPNHRRKLTTVGALMAAALLVSYWAWEYSSRMGPESLAVPTPSHLVRWQDPVVSYQYPAATPFTFSLPKLDRSPESVPVDVTLDASGDRPSWLQFDREQFSMHGVAPSTATDQTYRLIVRARPEQGSDSQLLVLLTIAGQSGETSPAPQLRGHWNW